MIKIIPILLEKIGLFYYLNNQMWSKYIKYFWQWNNMKQQMHTVSAPVPQKHKYKTVLSESTESEVYLFSETKSTSHI